VVARRTTPIPLKKDVAHLFGQDESFTRPKLSVSFVFLLFYANLIEPEVGGGLISTFDTSLDSFQLLLLMFSFHSGALEQNTYTERPSAALRNFSHLFAKCNGVEIVSRNSFVWVTRIWFLAEDAERVPYITRNEIKAKWCRQKCFPSKMRSGFSEVSAPPILEP